MKNFVREHYGECSVRGKLLGTSIPLSLHIIARPCHNDDNLVNTSQNPKILFQCFSWGRHTTRTNRPRSQSTIAKLSCQRRHNDVQNDIVTSSATHPGNTQAEQSIGQHVTWNGLRDHEMKPVSHGRIPTMGNAMSRPYWSAQKQQTEQQTKQKTKQNKKQNKTKNKTKPKTNKTKNEKKTEGTAKESTLIESVSVVKVIKSTWLSRHL